MSHLMDSVKFVDLGIETGHGSMLMGNGIPYIDFFTDVGTASLGYAAPEHERALKRVLRSGLVHHPILFRNADRDLAAERLCAMTGMDKVFFSNSGAESVECAIKIARKHWWDNKGKTNGGHPIIFCQRGSFHGRTLAGVAAGDGPWYHRSGFEPLPQGFGHFERWRDVPEDAAAIMISPIFGNNDVKPFSGSSWDENVKELRLLRNYCDQEGIILIFDEVQSGGGRCGAVTYSEKIGVRPDILTLGKGIAAGAPVGATLARGDFANQITPGVHFSTFGGNPLCIAFLDEMLDWLSKRENIARIEATGSLMERMLVGATHVLNIRRQGMLIGVDLDIDTLNLAHECKDGGLLLGAFRQGPGVLKLTPPLNITDIELNAGMKVLLGKLYA